MSDGHGKSPQQTTGSFRLREDYLVAVVILVCSAVVIALTMTFEDVPAALAQGVPPEDFPQLMVGVIAFLSVLLAMRAHRRPEPQRKRVPAMVYATAALLVLFVAMTDWIGTITTMILFCFALPVLWGERRYLYTAIFAILFPLAVYFLFSQTLEVRFPHGVLASLLN